MNDKDYTVKRDTQPGRINTDCKPITEIIVKCIICGNDVVINIRDNSPQVCEDCKKAILYAKELLKEK